MAHAILIIGKSGSGKSASMRNLKKQDVGIINVLGKPLPFKNDLATVKTDDYTRIKTAIASAKAKTIIVDDAGYLMTNQFMKGHASTGAGNAVFAFYNKIADSFWELIQYVTHQIPDDKTVYFIMHEDQNEFGAVKPKSIGKMLDEKVCIEGMFTIVFRATKDNGKYVFKTQSEGFDVAKTPMGMFDSLSIENDLKMIDDTIREYYGIQVKAEVKHGTEGVSETDIK